MLGQGFVQFKAPEVIIAVGGDIIFVEVIENTQDAGIAVVKAKIMASGKRLHTREIEDHAPVALVIQHFGHFPFGQVMVAVLRPGKTDSFRHKFRNSIDISVSCHNGDHFRACPIFLKSGVDGLHGSILDGAGRPLHQIEPGRGTIGHLKRNVSRKLFFKTGVAIDGDLRHAVAFEEFFGKRHAAYPGRKALHRGEFHLPHFLQNNILDIVRVPDRQAIGICSVIQDKRFLPMARGNNRENKCRKGK